MNHFMSGTIQVEATGGILAKRRKRWKKIHQILYDQLLQIWAQSFVCLIEGKAAEEEGGGEGRTKLIFPKEEGEPAN